MEHHVLPLFLLTKLNKNINLQLPFLTFDVRPRMSYAKAFKAYVACLGRTRAFPT